MKKKKGNTKGMEIVKIRCNAVQEGFLFAVRNGRLNRMRDHNGKKSWAKKEDAERAIARGLEVHPCESLPALVDV